MKRLKVQALRKVRRFEVDIDLPGGIMTLIVPEDWLGAIKTLGDLRTYGTTDYEGEWDDFEVYVPARYTAREVLE